MKKIFTLTLISVLALGKSVTAQFSENFDAATIPSLVSNCWVMNGVTTTNQPNENINNTSILTQPPVNPGMKIDMYSPIIVLLSTSATINFDYKLSQALANNATRSIQISIINLAGQVVKSDTIVMNSSTPTSVQHYNRQYTSMLPGSYRMIYRLTGANGNGNVRLAFDNLSLSNSALNVGACSFTPILEITLPVTLASFTATLNNASKVDLKWTTSTEINVSHFAIERSTDGTNFTDAAMVFAVGNTTDAQNYSHTDNVSAITSKIIYYRLRSVDNDGKVKYSETRIIRLTKTQGADVMITTFPNPVVNEVRVSIPNEWQNKKVIYQIVGASGQVVTTKTVANASQVESINTNSLSNGFYVVKVNCEGQTAIQKIVK